MPQIDKALTSKSAKWAHVISTGDPGTRSFFVELQDTEYWTDYIVNAVFDYVVTTEVKLFHFSDAITLMLMLWQDAHVNEMWLDGFEKVKDPFR